ncbi:superfamily I DNA/RNA helicase [Mycetocola sp. BIGb0189]|uniref:PD-(D/E)XK nuclease family protein n=1 Tax=Mycetocola sp. BIGb0189 TaxID=2940604 RepID=UPI002167EDD9|nr:PD-(D/E)XK nuclease family protein [Mycetocola sp. BIGb0189]MCS4275555.1 superfamily I DNA/RNA helicase [Mycetocola sp. BIGb0189]
MSESEPLDQDRLSASLDNSQRAVRDLRDGAHAAVHGAPGSGKTHTLTEVVADRIITRGYPTDDVVVLAADRRSATALRDTLALRIDRPTRGPLARTLGSLAFSFVTAAAVADGVTVPRLLTGADQDTILADLLAGEVEDEVTAWPESLGPDVRALGGFRTELRELMMRLVETRTRPAELARLGHQHERPEWVAAAAFIARYEHVMDQYSQPRLDAAEVIAEATTLLREGRVSAPRLIIVDDFQEQGPGTLGFLAAAAAAGSTILAFGDPDVASATFRGSDPAALSGLNLILGAPVETFTLTQVHRHGPELRAVITELSDRVGAAGRVEHRRAASVLPAQPAPAADTTGDAATPPTEQSATPPADLAADNPVGQASGVAAQAPVHPADESERGPWKVPPTLPVVRIRATSPAAEQQAIARMLRERHVYHGVPWSQMAIVVRSSASIPVLARALAMADVPTSAETAGEALRDRYAARALILALAVALERIPVTAARYTELLLGPLGGFDGIGLRRLRRALRHEELLGGGHRGSDDLLLEALAAPGRFATLDTPGARRAQRFAETLAQVRAGYAAGNSAEELAWIVWDRSGLEKTWTTQLGQGGLLAEEANTNLDAAVALFTAAKRAAERDPDADAGIFIDSLLEADLGEDSLAPRARGEAVWIGTPSAVVGREFDVVVAARVQAGAWPNLQLRGALLYPQLFSLVVAGLPTTLLDARAELLSDELRLFVLACSRARTQLVVSTTDGDDEQPSPFLRFPTLDGAPVRTGTGEYPLTLRGMVGALRRRLVRAHEAGRPEEAAEAASLLARLSDEGIAGASPDSWYGLAEPSTTEPLVDLKDPDARVRVSPSRMEAFEKSPLNWFIEDVARPPSTVAAGIGTIIHEAFERAGMIPADQITPADIAPERLWEHVSERWGELRFEAPWLAQRERAGVDEALVGVAAYLSDALRAGNVVLSTEGGFRLEVGQIIIGGSIDRIERRPATGADTEPVIVIIDLKTGRSIPTQKSMLTHAQLSAYQLALTRGAVYTEVPDEAAAEASTGAAAVAAHVAPLADSPADATAEAPVAPVAAPAEPAVRRHPITGRSGGAMLLYVRTPTVKAYAERVQEVQTEEELAAFEERVETVGTGMAAATFVGVFGEGEHDPLTRLTYRIHLIAAVSE